MIERYPFKIGKFQCVAIKDGEFFGNADILLANAPEDERNAVLASYGEVPDSMLSTWTCLLVQTGSQAVLIDTGAGESRSMGGKLLKTLEADGVSPEDIDIVILTHIHGDHIGGCLRESGALTFPNAAYVMGEAEWRFWTTEERTRSAPAWAVKVAQAVLPGLSKVIEVVEGQAEVVPGIEIIPAHGHTHGHVVVALNSAGEDLLYLSDAALHPIQIEYPHWNAIVDQYPQQTVQSRLLLYERASRIGSLVLGFHFHPFPSLGHIVSEGDKFRWVPLDRVSGSDPAW